MSGRIYHQVVVCIGSNASDRQLRLDEAEGFLKGLLGECECTPTIDSNDTSGRTELLYSNRLCRGHFAGDYVLLNKTLKEYEQERRSKNNSGEVAIDLDIVLFNGVIMRPGTYMSPYFQYLYSDLV